MPKDYFVTFGSASAGANAGLSPTMTIFATIDGATTAPGITAVPGATGVYYFRYSPGTTAGIFFQIDGGSGLNDADRYPQGTIDPIQAVDQRLGDTTASFGSTSVDPTQVFGYLKRIQELFEGDATFSKTAGTWDIYSRGSSTLLREKTLTNSSSSATKT